MLLLLSFVFLSRLVSSLTLPLHIDIELIQCQNYNKLCVHGKQKLIRAAAAATEQQQQQWKVVYCLLHGNNI